MNQYRFFGQFGNSYFFTLPYANFEFEVRGTRYVAMRSPCWFTLRPRAGGFKEEETHSLQSLGPQGAVLATMSRDMTARIEALLCLTHAEFAKILVLPQGEFQRFLEMNTADREGILKKLFPIDEHTRLMAHAKDQAEASRRTPQGLQAQIREAAGEAALDEAQAQARAQELTDLVQGMKDAEQEHLRLRDAAHQAYQRGQGEDKAFADQALLLEAQADFQSAKPQRDLLDQELQLARKAARCEDKVTRLRFVLVHHPVRGTIFLLSTDLTLEPLEIIQLYGYRFKIELGFRQAVHVIGSYALALARALEAMKVNKAMGARDAPACRQFLGRR